MYSVETKGEVASIVNPARVGLSGLLDKAFVRRVARRIITQELLTAAGLVNG